MVQKEQKDTHEAVHGHWLELDLDKPYQRNSEFDKISFAQKERVEGQQCDYCEYCECRENKQKASRDMQQPTTITPKYPWSLNKYGDRTMHYVA